MKIEWRLNNNLYTLTYIYVNFLNIWLQPKILFVAKKFYICVITYLYYLLKIKSF